MDRTIKRCVCFLIMMLTDVNLLFQRAHHVSPSFRRWRILMAEASKRFIFLPSFEQARQPLNARDDKPLIDQESALLNCNFFCLWYSVSKLQTINATRKTLSFAFFTCKVQVSTERDYQWYRHLCFCHLISPQWWATKYLKSEQRPIPLNCEFNAIRIGG
jgi:hypothetical protein